VRQEAIGPAKTLKTAHKKKQEFSCQEGKDFFGKREAENAPNFCMATSRKDFPAPIKADGSGFSLFLTQVANNSTPITSAH
jgi:hypothetical protein